MNILVKNDVGDELFSTIPDACRSCLSNFSDKYKSTICPNNGNNCRQAMRIQRDRTIIACSQDIKTTRNFNELLSNFVFSLPYLEKTISKAKQRIELTEKNYTKTLLHNLVNQNAHIIQLLDRYIPQNERFVAVSATIKNTSQKVGSEPDKVALTLFKLKKLASSMKAEFSAYKRLRTNDAGSTGKCKISD